MAFQNFLHCAEFLDFLVKNDLALPSNPLLDSEYSLRLGSIKHPNKKSRILKYYDASRSHDGNEFVRVHWFSKNIPDAYYVLGGTNKPLTEKQKREQEQIIKAKEEEKAKRIEDNRIKAQTEYFNCGSPCKHHPYLTKKNIYAYYGVKVASQNYSYEDAEKITKFRMRKGELIIPAVSLDKVFMTYQRITTTGRKFMATATASKGAMYPIGVWLGNDTKRVFLCEGYATGATLYESLTDLIMVCFSLNNLMYLCEEIAEKYPDVEIIICTDFDKTTKDQAGLLSGMMIARKLNVKFIFPTAVISGSDWNDLYIEKGLQAVTNSIQTQLNLFKKKSVPEVLEDYTHFLNEINNSLWNEN